MSEYFVTKQRPPKPSLDSGTTAHYADPDYYDRAYERHRADIGFYLQNALELGGPVLELGCGTGRITLPVARAGIEIVGVDISQTMLASARAKLATQSDDVRRLVTLRRADIRSLRLRRKFRLIISPFNVLQHLYSRPDLERCFDVVRRHLMPRAGRFVFDVLLPDVRSLARNPEKRYRLGQVYHPAGDKRYDYRESFDYDPITQVEYITMYFDDQERPERSFETPLCHRQFFPAELEALIHYNGFDLVHCFGGFDREPLDDDSESQVCICRRMRRRRPSRP